MMRDQAELASIGPEALCVKALSSTAAGHLRQALCGRTVTRPTANIFPVLLAIVTRLR